MSDYKKLVAKWREKKKKKIAALKLAGAKVMKPLKGRMVHLKGFTIIDEIPPPLEPPPRPRRKTHPGETMRQLRDAKLQTQKARGIRACIGYEALFDCHTPRIWTRNCLRAFDCSEVGVLDCKGEVAYWGTALSFPLFARPCPIRPRHGFVESRVVHDKDQLDQLVKETLSVDPEAEVFLMKPIDAAWSGVVTNAGIVLGLGSDGATAGRKSLMIPTPPVQTRDWLGTRTPEAAGITTSPYLEVVADRNAIIVPYAVQLRDGPEPPGGTDYIPKPIKVRGIIVPPDDLMLWERRVALGLPRGTVVWIESGSLSCHAAVHALLHKIPVVCGGPAPRIGETLSQSQEPTRLNHDDYILLARLISELWQRDWMCPEGSHGAGSAALSIGTLHALPAWDNDWRLVRLRAHGVVAMARLMAAACLGETRHWYSRNSNGSRDDVPLRCDFLGKHQGQGRTDIWYAAGHLRLPALREACEQSVLDLKDPGWVSGYGGRKWVVAMNVTIRLLQGLDKFIVDPTPRRWRALVNHWNRAVFVCHNGKVPVLTKWISYEFLSAIAKAPQLAFLFQENARIALELPTERAMK